MPLGDRTRSRSRSQPGTLPGGGRDDSVEVAPASGRRAGRKRGNRSGRKLKSDGHFAAATRGGFGWLGTAMDFTPLCL